MRVTVLGMGSMGRALAGRALEKGHEVTVWNRSPGRTGELAAAGARVADGAADAVAWAEVTLVVVSDDAAVLGLCLGGGGALAGLDPAGTGLLLNISTVSPETVRRVARDAPAGRVLDSPVMGSPTAIANGRGRFLVGGPHDAVERLAPLWDDLGAGFLHAGPLGSGAVLKLVSNMLLITGIAALAEGITIARRQGIDDTMLKALFSDSLVTSPADRIRLDSLLDDAHPGWFTPELARKDVRLAIDLAERGEVPVRMGPAAAELLNRVIDGGRQWEDLTAVIEALAPPEV